MPLVVRWQFATFARQPSNHIPLINASTRARRVLLCTRIAMAHRLSAVIPCKNEQRHLRACIASARLVADEVLVADSGSTDDTLAIAAQMGCRIIQREYRTSGDFKNWAIPQARNQWVLILDADERVTPQLAEEINQLLAGEPECDGYWTPRYNLFFGKRLRYGAWRPTTLMRLFRRDLGRYVGATDHAEVEIASGRMGTLAESLEHDAMWSYDRLTYKMYRYADVQAQVWHEQGRQASFRQLLFRGPLRFLHDYILRRGFLDGAVGLQAAAMVAYGSYFKQARLWELQHAPAQLAPPQHDGPQHDGSQADEDASPASSDRDQAA